MVSKKAILMTALYFVVFLYLIITAFVFDSTKLFELTFVYVIIGGLVTRKLVDYFINNNNDNSIEK